MTGATNSDVTAMAYLKSAIVQGIQTFTFYKRGYRVFAYLNLSNMPNDAEVEICVLPEGYRPTLPYAVADFYVTVAPFTSKGTVWIARDTGKMTLYKESGWTAGYVYVEFDSDQQ